MDLDKVCDDQPQQQPHGPHHVREGAHHLKFAYSYAYMHMHILYVIVLRVYWQDIGHNLCQQLSHRT